MLIHEGMMVTIAKFSITVPTTDPYETPIGTVAGILTVLIPAKNEVLDHWNTIPIDRTNATN